jgi:microcin C transport system substrate-binding protein
MLKKILLIFTAFFFISNSLSAADFKHGISVFGDLKYPANFKHFNYTNPNAPKGGQIKHGVEGTFNSLNPFILKGISAAGMDMIFDTLMEDSADEISSKYGLIAKIAKIADDKKSITFWIRKTAKFHDGSKITANDVIFSFNLLRNKGHPSYALIYRDVLDARKINNYKVQFIFKDNKNRELPLILGSLPVFSKKYYEANEFDKTTFDSPLGSGPYEVKEVNPGKSITFKRVNNYWAKNLPVNAGRHNFDIIKYDYYRDNNVLVEAFKAGEYDFKQENIARNWATAYNVDKVKNDEIIKKEITHSLPAPMQSFVFNLRREKFANQNLRHAIALAFDFEWVKEKIFYGSYARTESFFTNSKFASKGLPSTDELKIIGKFKNKIPAQVFNQKFSLPKSDGSGYNRTNLLKAKQILQNAGYYLKDQKLIDPTTNQPIDIEFLINSKAFQMVIAPMIKNLEKLGINSKIRMVEENQYRNRIKNYDYDIIVSVFGSGMIPGNELFSYWHSSQKDIIGGNNLAGVSNEAVDYLVEKIPKTKNKNDLEILTKCLDRILLWNFYVIPQWHNQSYRILYKNKFAMPRNNPPYSLALDSWWQKE